MPAPVRRGISRFIVMAILQAARAERLGLPRDSAYSWGLNRAIFYAAAKQGFRHGGASAPGEPSVGGAEREHPERAPYSLGDDLAFRDTRTAKLYFTIGEETQTEKEFERQIIARFGERSHFTRAWSEARSIIGQSDESTLRSGPGFYERVYKPRRDALREAWTGMSGTGPVAPARRAGR
ncbi:MAG TPA: hypothetical protein VEL82_06960 [Thermoplasmata archaeon]|nr:hypothetical protein [Thermoplasmata archaeon]